METIKKNSGFIFIIIVIIGIGWFLRLKYLMYNLPFFCDEAWVAANILHLKYGELCTLNYMQACPPMFLFISKFLLDISHQAYDIYSRDLIFRIVPFISSLLTLPLFAYFCQKLYKNKLFTLAALASLSLSVIAIDYAQEFKQYSFEMLFTILLLYSFYFVNIQNDPFKKLALYSAVFAISPWCSLSSLFILPAGFLLLIAEIIKNKAYDTKRLLFIFAPFAVSMILFMFVYFLPNYYSAHDVSNFNQLQTFWTRNTDVFVTKDNIISSFYSCSQDLIRIPFNLVSFYIFLLINLLILFFNKNYKIITLTVCPVLICLLASSLKLYPFFVRLIVFLLPVYIILYCQLILKIKDKIVFQTLTVIIILYFAFLRLSDEHLEEEFKNIYTDQRESDFIINLPETRTVYDDLRENHEKFLIYFGCFKNDFDPLHFYFPWEYYTFYNKEIVDFTKPYNLEDLENKEYWGYINDNGGTLPETDNIEIFEEYEQHITPEYIKEVCYLIRKDDNCSELSFNYEYAKLFRFKKEQ